MTDCASCSSNQQSKKKSTLQFSNCAYTSFYCEENVWRMCDQISKCQPDILSEYYAVFISNKNKQVPLWMQKQTKDPLTPVVWDYHVVLMQKPKEGSPLVYDLDSLMAFPCQLKQYLQQAIQSEKNMKKEYHRKFRIIEADDFLSSFASDRSHMLKSNGEYVQPPPNHPAIRTDDELMNLDDFIDMTPIIGKGKVKDIKGLVKYFGLPSEAFL